MNRRALMTLLTVSSMLTACAFGYEAHGRLSDVAGDMKGKAQPGNRGGGRFVLVDRDRRLTCEGEARPPARSPDPGSCRGEAGEGTLRCSDGREMPLRWEAISCRSWRGSGVDAAGNRLEFTVERR